MKKLNGLILLFSLITFQVFAQIGGSSTYNFLNLAPSARVGALGGNALGTFDKDVNLVFHNPALLDSNMNHNLALNFTPFVADIKFGSAIYAFRLKNIGMFSAALQFINYGQFQQTDPSGNLLGQFSAGEYNFQLGYSKRIKPKIKIGGNLKTIGSFLESYTSYGLALDVSGMYIDTAKNWAVTALIKNLGTQIKAYRAGNLEPLPFDIQLAVSKRLKHLPLRWGVVLHNLHRFDIRYNDPNDAFSNQQQFLVEDDEVKEKKFIADKIFRHVILNTELYLGKSLTVRVGYNHLRRQELAIPFRGGRNGFTWGFGIKIKRFEFSYGNAAYSLAGASNHFSLGLKLK